QTTFESGCVFCASFLSPSLPPIKRPPHNSEAASCEQARGLVRLARGKNSFRRQLLKDGLEVERDGLGFRHFDGRHFSILDGDNALIRVYGHSGGYIQLLENFPRGLQR